MFESLGQPLSLVYRSLTVKSVTGDERYPSKSVPDRNYITCKHGYAARLAGARKCCLLFKSLRQPLTLVYQSLAAKPVTGV